jgi:hypothetical protein
VTTEYRRNVKRDQSIDKKKTSFYSCKLHALLFLKRDMDGLQFHWGDPIDNVLKPLLMRTLTDVCHSVPSYTSTNGRTRKDVYNFLAHQDEKTQRIVFDEFQRHLANPTSQTCKASWMLKRKMEDEETKIRNVRARLENISNNLRRHGRCD